MGWRLLIISNNERDALDLNNAFAGLAEFTLGLVTTSGAEGLAYFRANGADAALVDLLLTDCDAFNLIDALGADGAAPPIFAMSALRDDRFLSIIASKVVYCFLKPLDLAVIPIRTAELLRMMEFQPLRQPTAMELLDGCIADCIRAVGVPVHLKGYYYLREAVRIYTLAPSPVTLGITIDIYPVVAKLYNTKSILVEHAMRNAIEIAWTRGNIDTIFEYFGYTINDHKGKPSNLEFVAMIAEKVRGRFCFVRRQQP